MFYILRVFWLKHFEDWTVIVYAKNLWISKLFSVCKNNSDYL